MPNRTIDGKLKGTITCRGCGIVFCGHISTRYCSKECKPVWKRIGVAKENPITKRARKVAYRLKHKESGLCKHCPKPALSGQRCELHVRKQKQQDRVYKAKKNYGPLWERQVELLTIKDQIQEIENVAIKLISQEPKRHALDDSGAIEIWRNTRE